MKKKILITVGIVYLTGVLWAAYNKYQGQKKSGHTPELKMILSSGDVWAWPLALVIGVR